MDRFSARAAVLITLLLSAISAASAELISTNCEEIEVVIDGRTTVSRLGDCGDHHGDDLLWHLDRIDQIDGLLDGRFARRNRGTGSVVYVMDTGVMATHDEFASPNGSRVIAGYDTSAVVGIGASSCTSTNKALAPCFNDTTELAAAAHGTSVASIVAGNAIGVAPEARIVSVRVMNERGLATTRSYLEGLDSIVRDAWSRNDSPSTAIVNISGWMLERLASMSSDSQPVVAYETVEKKMREMIAGVGSDGRALVGGKRFLFVVAGNNLDGGCGRAGLVDRFPATLGTEVEGMITVGGMTPDNYSWSGACRGGVEILAPAQGIFSASVTAKDHYRGRKPNQRSGTSFAAPIVSGIAALMLAERPDATPQQLEAWITSTPARTATRERRSADGKVASLLSLPPQRIAGASITPPRAVRSK